MRHYSTWLGKAICKDNLPSRQIIIKRIAAYYPFLKKKKKSSTKRFISVRKVRQGDGNRVVCIRIKTKKAVMS